MEVHTSLSRRGHNSAAPCPGHPQPAGFPSAAPVLCGGLLRSSTATPHPRRPTPPGGLPVVLPLADLSWDIVFGWQLLNILPSGMSPFPPCHFLTAETGTPPCGVSRPLPSARPGPLFPRGREGSGRPHAFASPFVRFRRVLRASQLSQPPKPKPF